MKTEIRNTCGTARLAGEPWATTWNLMGPQSHPQPDRLPLQGNIQLNLEIIMLSAALLYMSPPEGHGTLTGMSDTFIYRIYSTPFIPLCFFFFLVFLTAYFRQRLKAQAWESDNLGSNSISTTYFGQDTFHLCGSVLSSMKERQCPAPGAAAGTR